MLFLAGVGKNAGSRKRRLLLDRENGKEVHWNAGCSTFKGVIFGPVGNSKKRRKLGDLRFAIWAELFPCCF